MYKVSRRKGITCVLILVGGLTLRPTLSRGQELAKPAPVQSVYGGFGLLGGDPAIGLSAQLSYERNHLLLTLAGSGQTDFFDYSAQIGVMGGYTTTVGRFSVFATAGPAFVVSQLGIDLEESAAESILELITLIGLFIPDSSVTKRSVGVSYRAGVQLPPISDAVAFSAAVVGNLNQNLNTFGVELSLQFGKITRPRRKP